MCWYVLSRLCVGVEAQCVKVVEFVQEYVAECSPYPHLSRTLLFVT